MRFCTTFEGNIVTEGKRKDSDTNTTILTLAQQVHDVYPFRSGGGSARGGGGLLLLLVSQTQRQRGRKESSDSHNRWESLLEKVTM